MKYTVVVTEESSPFPPPYNRPLIYVLDLDDPHDAEAIKEKIAMERFEEIQGTFRKCAEDRRAVREIAEGLQLEFVLAGEPETIADFRE